MRDLRDHQTSVRLPSSSHLPKHVESCALWFTLGRHAHIAGGRDGLEMSINIACHDKAPSILALALAIMILVQRVP